MSIPLQKILSSVGFVAACAAGIFIISMLQKDLEIQQQPSSPDFRIDPAGNFASLRGFVTPIEASAVFRWLKDNVDHPVKLILESPVAGGGFALDLAKLVDLHGAVTTVVPEGAVCRTACSLVWLAGDKRILEPGATLGFGDPACAPEMIDNRCAYSAEFALFTYQSLLNREPVIQHYVLETDALHLQGPDMLLIERPLTAGSVQTGSIHLAPVQAGPGSDNPAPATTASDNTTEGNTTEGNTGGATNGMTEITTLNRTVVEIASSDQNGLVAHLIRNAQTMRLPAARLD